MIDLPGYRLIGELGQGGMAHVYLAEQQRSVQMVAIKVLSPPLQQQGVGERFLREARIAAQLVHPNIVHVHDVGEHAGRSYIVLEHVAGGTLDDRLRRGLSASDALDVCADVASALAYAHRQGYVHRDIKPANILFRDDGSAVLTDFGVAHAVDDALPATLAGAFLGTPHYVSPEQAGGHPVDGRADLYSLGVVLYRMVVGKLPFDAPTALAIAVRHVTEPAPKLPPHLTVLQPLLDRLLAKDPAARFQDAEALLTAIGELAPARPTLEQSRVRTETIAREEIHATQRSLPAAPLPSEFQGEPSRRQRARLDPVLRARLGYGVLAVALLGIVMLTMHGLEQRERLDDLVDREKAELIRQAQQQEAQDPLAAARLYLQALARDRNQSDRDIEQSLEALRGNIHNDMLARLERGDSGIVATLEATAELFPDDGRFARIAQRLAALQQIGDVLDRADAYVDGGALMEPGGASAFALYQQVLARDPGNSRALAGLDRIAAEYAARATEALRGDDLAAARRLAGRARSSRRDHPDLAIVETEIAARETRRGTVLELSAQAAAALEQGALLPPREPNARDLFKRALALDARHEPARLGLLAVGEALAAQALEQVRNEQLDLARALADEAEVLAADAPTVVAARSAVSAEAERVSRVNALLDRARQRAAAGYLSEPVTDSALGWLRQVIELDPDNEQALTLRREVGARLGAAAETAWEAGMHDLAVDYARRAANADPDSATWRDHVQRWRADGTVATP